VEPPAIPNLQAELFPTFASDVDRLVVLHVIIEHRLFIVFAVENWDVRDRKMERAAVGSEQIGKTAPDFAAPMFRIDCVERRQKNGERRVKPVVVARSQGERRLVLFALAGLGGSKPPHSVSHELLVFYFKPSVHV
jgi:hypothetical protein